MYPQGVCRIRKPAYAGNGCAIFLVFQTEEVGQKDGCGSQTQLRGVALIKIKMKNLLILTTQYSTINGCVYVLNVISYILMELKRFQFPHFTEDQVFSYIVGRTGRKAAAAFFCFQP